MIKSAFRGTASCCACKRGGRGGQYNNDKGVRAERRGGRWFVAFADGGVGIYGKNGRLTARKDAAGNTVSLRYDPVGRLARISGNGHELKFLYKGNGPLTGIRDANGRLVYRPDSHPLSERTYEYDQEGSPSRVVDERRQSVRYRYDPDGQLVQEHAANDKVRYLYGSAGRRIAKYAGGGRESYRYDAGGRLMQVGSRQLAYDADGNLVSLRDDRGSTRFGYDAENRLIEVRKPNGDYVRYGYGAFGERLWREQNNERSYFIYDSDDPLLELSGDHQPLRHYLFAGTDRPVAVTRDGTVHYIHQDALGSVIAVSDGKGEAISRFPLRWFRQPHADHENGARPALRIHRPAPGSAHRPGRPAGASLLSTAWPLHQSGPETRHDR